MSTTKTTRTIEEVDAEGWEDLISALDSSVETKRSVGIKLDPPVTMTDSYGAWTFAADHVRVCFTTWSDVEGDEDVSVTFYGPGITKAGLPHRDGRRGRRSVYGRSPFQIEAAAYWHWNRKAREIIRNAEG